MQYDEDGPECHLLSDLAKAEHPLLKATWDSQTQ